MAAKWIEARTGSLEHKRQYRQAMARTEALAEPYRNAAKAFNRYLTYFAGFTDGDTLVRMFADHADLWERAAVDGTPVRTIVGENPVEFAETFARAYSGREWIERERTRLTRAIDGATGETGQETEA